MDQKYPIVKAERVQTRYGETILLSNRDLLNPSVRDLTGQANEGVPTETLRPSL